MRALAFPVAGSPSPQDIRRVVIKKFPFSIAYRPDADGMSYRRCKHSFLGFKQATLVESTATRTS
jgi:hypothetical protein